MHKLILTGASGKHKQFQEISYPLMREYAAKHDYSTSCVDFDQEYRATGRPGAWAKIEAIKMAIDSGKYDYVLWLDVDLIILRSDTDIFSDCTTADYFHMVKHVTPSGHVPNTGVWMIKCCPETSYALDLVWNCQDTPINHAWWEQAAFMHLAGYQTQGTTVFHTGKTENEIFEKINWLSLEWNSHPNDKHFNPRINHWTLGPGTFDWRLAQMKEDAPRSDLNA